MEVTFTPLNVRDIVAHYNPKIAKIIPKFYYKRLNKLLHVEELNGFLKDNYDDTEQEFLEATIKHLELKTKFTGLENLTKIKDQHPIIVANHPTGGPESLVLFSQVHLIFPQSKILMQSFLSQIKPMKKVSVYNHAKLKTTLGCIKAGKTLVMFPAGLCSHVLKKNKTEVVDKQWKATFVKLGKRYDRPIVPVYISGSLSKRFHRWYTFRHYIHLNIAIEAMYLVDEMYKLRGSEITFNIGKPIYPDSITQNVDFDIWAGRIRQYVYELKNNPSAIFDPKKKDTYPLPKYSKKTYKDK